MCTPHVSGVCIPVSRNSHTCSEACGPLICCGHSVCPGWEGGVEGRRESRPPQPVGGDVFVLNPLCPTSCFLPHPVGSPCHPALPAPGGGWSRGHPCRLPQRAFGMKSAPRLGDTHLTRTGTHTYTPGLSSVHCSPWGGCWTTHTARAGPGCTPMLQPPPTHTIPRSLTQVPLWLRTVLRALCPVGCADPLWPLPRGD